MPLKKTTYEKVQEKLDIATEALKRISRGGLVPSSAARIGIARKALKNMEAVK